MSATLTGPGRPLPPVAERGRPGPVGGVLPHPARRRAGEAARRLRQVRAGRPAAGAVAGADAAWPRAGRSTTSGFRLPDAAALVAMQERLERAGHPVAARGRRRVLLRPADEVLGARPGRHPVGGVHARRRHRPPRRRAGPREGDAATETPPPASVTWEHHLGQPVPRPHPLADGRVDEVRLRGSLNLPLSEEEGGRLLSEARRCCGRAGGCSSTS